jgi:hypothetical protein
MLTRSESEELYERSGKDALIWLEKAEGHRYSARILKNQLLEMVSDNTPAWSRRIETLGVVSSTLLLLGLAFENLIKGVYVARNPTLVDRTRLDRSLWQSDSGHGIATFAKTLMTLTPEEDELLDRLQEYVVWAGRFPIPTKSGRYHQNLSPVNKHQFSTADFETADRLFEKLKEQLTKSRETQSAA